MSHTAGWKICACQLFLRDWSAVRWREAMPDPRGLSTCNGLAQLCGWALLTAIMRAQFEKSGKMWNKQREPSVLWGGVMSPIVQCFFRVINTQCIIRGQPKSGVVKHPEQTKPLQVLLTDWPYLPAYAKAVFQTERRFCRRFLNARLASKVYIFDHRVYRYIFKIVNSLLKYSKILDKFCIYQLLIQSS